MYLEISELLIDNYNSQIKENIKNLLDAYKQGIHIIALENRLKGRILTSIFENEPEYQQIIQYIYNKHQENKTLKKKLNAFVKVTPSEATFCRSSSTDKQTIFNVPITYFDEPLLKTSLITENLEDGIFYAGLIDRIQCDQIFDIPQSISLKFTNDPGGGSQIHRVFKNKAENEKRFTFSICDSDKNSITGCFGETAKQLNHILKKISSQTICDVLTIGVREKENLIAPHHYLAHNTFKNLKGLEALVEIDKQNEQDVNIHFLKISGDSPNTVKFLEENCGKSFSSKEYSVGKKGLGIIASDFIFTDNYLKNENIEHRRNKKEYLHYSNHYECFFKSSPPKLMREYKILSINFMSWACSYTKLRLLS